MKNTLLYLKILLLMTITIVCFSISSVAAYHLIEIFIGFDAENHSKFGRHDRGIFDFFVLAGAFMFLIPLLISTFAFLKLRSIYKSFYKRHSS